MAYYINCKDTEKHLSSYSNWEENNLKCEENYSKWFDNLLTAINRGKFQRVKSLTQSELFPLALQEEPEVIYNAVISTKNLRLFNYFLGYTSQFNNDFMYECVIKEYIMDNGFYVEYEFDKDGNKLGQKCYEVMLRDKPYAEPMPLSKFIEYIYEYNPSSYDFLLRNCSPYLVKSALIRLLPLHLVKGVPDYKSYLINLKENGYLTDFGLHNWDKFITRNRFDIIKFLVEELDFEISNDWCKNFENNWPCYSDYGINETDTIKEIPFIGRAYKQGRYDMIKYFLDSDPQLKNVLSYDELILCSSNFELFKLLVSYWDDVDANASLKFWYYQLDRLGVTKLNYILDKFNIITENKIQLMFFQMYEANRHILKNRLITSYTFEIIHRMLNELDETITLGNNANLKVDIIDDIDIIDKAIKCQDRTFLYYKTFYNAKTGSLDGVEKNIDRLRI